MIRSVRRYARIYGRLVAASVRSQWQYRASFALYSASQLVATLAEFGAIWALYARFGSLPGWRLPEVAVLYGISNVAFALAEAGARGFDVFPGMVRTGDFDRLLLRPLPTAFQLAAHEVQIMRVGRLVQGSAILAWGCMGLGIEWDAARVSLVGLCVVGGACIFAGLFVLQATLAFWTIESLEVVNIVTYGGNQMAQYPLTIYRPWFRLFFTVAVPLAAINTVPMAALLSRPELSGLPAPLTWLAPCVGGPFLAACLLVWKLGERRYASTGS
jgi:ABC-2 type transport system permease protein